MGKGDKRTKRGKITIGSYGKSRPRKVEGAAVAPAAPVISKASVAAPKADKKKKA